MVNYGYTDNAPSADLYDSRAWTRHADPLSYGTPLMGPDEDFVEWYPLVGFFDLFSIGYSLGKTHWDRWADADPPKYPSYPLDRPQALGFAVGWTCRHIGDLRGVNSAYALASMDAGVPDVPPLVISSPIDFHLFDKGYRQARASGRLLNCGRVQYADAYSMGYTKGRLDNFRNRCNVPTVAPYNEVVTQLRWEGVL